MDNSRRSIGLSSAPLLFVVLFFATGYILFPMYALVRESLASGGPGISFESYKQLLRPSLAEAAFNSVAISLLSVLGSACVGTFFAYGISFFDFPGKKILAILVYIPLALPPLVGVISFLFLIGESGMVSRSLAMMLGLSPAIFTVRGWTGILLVHIYSFYVYFYLFVSSALQQLDGNVFDASASLGASRARTVRKVLLPMITPALVGASLMTFMSSMASFSAPFLFGGSTRFLTLEIYTAKLNGDNSSAAALALLLALISATALLFLRWWQTRKRYLLTSKGTGRAPDISHGAATKGIVVGGMILLVLLFALPILTVVLISFVKEGSWTYQIFPTSFTAANYLRVFSEPGYMEPFLNSLEMALIATAGVLVVGVIAAYCLNRLTFRGNRALESVLSLPFGIPGTVIAVGLILAFNRPSVFSFQSVLVGTFWIMPLAYMVRNLPLLQRSTTAGLEAFSPSLYEAAETLGSSNRRTFRRIVLPIIVPSIASGALLVFINSVGEFVSSVLLYSYATKPISVEILSQLRLFNLGVSAVYSTLLMLLVLAAVAIANKFFRSAFVA